MSSIGGPTARPMSSGFLSLPLALLMAALASAALGLLGLMTLWQAQASRQLRLDQCARELSLELRSVQRNISRLNTQIRVARAATAVALSAGQAEVAAGTQRTTQVLALLQNSQLLRWSGRQAAQAFNRECPLAPLHATAFLTPLPWHRPPPDPLGEPPLEWTREDDLELQIHLAKKGVSTHAAVRRDQTQNWIASFELSAHHPIPGTR